MQKYHQYVKVKNFKNAKYTEKRAFLYKTIILGYSLVNQKMLSMLCMVHNKYI